MKQMCLSGVICETLLYLESVCRIIKMSTSAEMGSPIKGRATHSLPVSSPILFLGIIFLVVVELSGNFILSVFRRFKVGTPEDHPDLGQSILTGDPPPDSNKWKFFGSVHGNPDVQQLQAVYHYDKTDNGVEPYILSEGSGLIKG